MGSRLLLKHYLSNTREVMSKHRLCCTCCKCFPRKRHHWQRKNAWVQVYFKPQQCTMSETAGNTQITADCWRERTWNSETHWNNLVMQGKVFRDIFRDKKRKCKEYTSRIPYCIAHSCKQTLLWVLKKKKRRKSTRRRRRLQMDC